MKNNRMTKLTTLILFLFIAVSATSQTRINAKDIMKDLKNGKTVSYKNATIVGVLDFTSMDEKLSKLPKRKSSWWGTGSNSNKIVEEIKGKVSFENCTFEDNVFAYIPDEDSGYTFTADFNDDAIFKNCTFNEMALFKYSHFEEKADFTDTKFKGESTFKYAEFKNYTNFSNTQFEESSTFKYSVFNNNVSFANSKFKETATFKYAKFKDGVSFNKTTFDHDLIIKYTKISGNFDISGMHVEYEIDSKYSNINGKKFSY
jgi:uncharacterized protein YjbI with pentapeptide repeats